jgi:hypothetical protein
MIYMNKSLLHLSDGPFQRLLQGLRHAKIKLRKLAAEDLKVMGGNDRSFGEAFVGADQFARQEVLDPLSLCRRRK